MLKFFSCCCSSCVAFPTPSLQTAPPMLQLSRCFSCIAPLALHLSCFSSHIVFIVLLLSRYSFCVVALALFLLHCSQALLFSHYNSHVVPFALQFLHSFSRAIALALLLMHYPSWAKVHNVTLLPQLLLSHFSQVCVYLVFVALFMLPLLLYFAWLMWYFPPALAICRLEFGALTPTWAPKISYITYFHFLIYFLNCNLVFCCIHFVFLILLLFPFYFSFYVLFNCVTIF